MQFEMQFERLQLSYKTFTQRKKLMVKYSCVVPREQLKYAEKKHGHIH